MDRVAFTRNTLRDFVSHFAFGIVHDNIIVRHQKSVGNFTLCRETFARAGSAEDQTIGVLQLLPVYHDKVVGQSIQAVVQRFLAALVQFLRGKRNEDGGAAGGQAALNLDLVIGQRQRGHKPLLLLVVQSAEIAVVFLRNGAGLKHVIFQFLLGTSGVQHDECHQKHSLVLALQFFQQSLGISAIGGEVRRNDVDVVSGTDCFLLVE